jgi:hypothetical protein
MRQHYVGSSQSAGTGYVGLCCTATVQGLGVIIFVKLTGESMMTVILREMWIALAITVLALAEPALGIAGVAGGAESGHAASDRAADEISAQGTVQFIELEGGFWGIIGVDGKHYDVVNLPKEFQQQGLRVKFTGRVRPSQISFHMWGVIVEIMSVERLGVTGK